MIVVDSSAVVDALTTADGSGPLRGRLAADELHAPDLIDYEVVSALRGLTLGRHLSPERAGDPPSDFDDLTMTRWASAHALRTRSFQLRATVSAHDAAYVALAEALGVVLVTRDRRLARSTGHQVTIELL